MQYAGNTGQKEKMFAVGEGIKAAPRRRAFEAPTLDL
jgi:hypothetical protein